MGGLGDKGERKAHLADTDNSLVMTRGRGVGQEEEGEGGQMVMEGDLTWGGEHTLQCTHDILYNCAPETYIMLFTNVTPIIQLKVFSKEKLFPTPRFINNGATCLSLKYFQLSLNGIFYSGKF